MVEMGWKGKDGIVRREGMGKGRERKGGKGL